MKENRFSSCKDKLPCKYCQDGGGGSVSAGLFGCYDAVKDASLSLLPGVAVIVAANAVDVSTFFSFLLEPIQTPVVFPANDIAWSTNTCPFEAKSNVIGKVLIENFPNIMIAKVHFYFILFNIAWMDRSVIPIVFLLDPIYDPQIPDANMFVPCQLYISEQPHMLA